MRRGTVLHLFIGAALAAAWFFTPSAHAGWATFAVSVVLALLVAYLVSSPKVQLFVPTIFEGSPDSKAVALTFDDGPHPVYTPSILEILREHDAKATFFLVGRAAEAHPDLVRRIVAEGHLVGSHTYEHAHTFHLRSARRIAEDIARGARVIEAITGTIPRYFRPPQGLRVPTLRDALATLESPPLCVTWTVRGIDTLARSADAIVRRIARRLVPGAIVALHDGSGWGGRASRTATVEAVKTLLVEARARELACVRLDDLVAIPKAERTLPAWRRAGRVCLVTSAFAWFWLGAIILAWLVLPMVALAVRNPVKRMRACQSVVSGTFRVFHGYMRLLGLLDAVLPSELPRPTDGPVVIVANHTTLVDVTAILSRFPHTCCLAKPSMVDNKLFGRLLRLCGFISAGVDLATRGAALKTAIQRLEQGFDVLVFPEGTRSPPHDLLPFQRGAFEIACRARVPVVPLLLRCQPSALTRDRPFWRQPDRCAVLTVEVTSPFDPAQTNHHGSALRTRVETSYREALGLPLTRKIVTADAS